MAINTDHTSDTLTPSTGTLTVSGAIAGNASTATALSTSRTYELTGDVTGSINSTLSTGLSIATTIGTGVIVDADVNASAAIAGSKISPDFGNQNIATTGTTGGRLRPPAGVATANGAPLELAAGINLTTPEAGSIEYDGTCFFGTPDITSGRGHIGPRQTFRLTSNGGAVGPTIGDYFGTTSAVNLAATSVYEVVFFAYLQKTTAGTLTWTLTASSAPTVISGVYRGSPVTGIAAGAPITGYAGSRASATAAFAATASVSNNAFMTFEIRAQVVTNLATTFKLQVTNSAGSVTPQAGSFYTVRKVCTTTGSFA